MSPPLLLVLLSGWVAMPPSTPSQSAPPATELAGLMVLDPADAERHFITTFSDGPFAFADDDELPPPTQEAPVERVPDLGAAPTGAPPQ